MSIRDDWIFDECGAGKLANLERNFAASSRLNPPSVLPRDMMHRGFELISELVNHFNPSS
jgi:hypothetical protein